MAFAIQQDQQGAVRILALSGRLDTETSADLELALQICRRPARRTF
jgi:hypothetical protein